MTDRSKNPGVTAAFDGDARRACAVFQKKLTSTKDNARRLRILRAYARLEARISEMILVESLGDPCEVIRDYIVRELGARPDLDIDFLCARLGGPPWYARSAVLRIAGMRRAERAVRHIRRILEDANADVRKCAAEALGDIGGRESLPLLVKMRTDPSPYVRGAAEEALRKASTVRFS